MDEDKDREENEVCRMVHSQIMELISPYCDTSLGFLVFTIGKIPEDQYGNCRINSSLRNLGEAEMHVITAYLIAHFHLNPVALLQMANQMGENMALENRTQGRQN